MIENRIEKNKKLHTNNGIEFYLNEFKAYCKSQCFVRHQTILYRAQQNGVAKHWKRTIISKTRYMLSNLGLNRHFQDEVGSIACYLINCLSYITLGKKTLIEICFGSPDDYSQLRVFGCVAYAHVDNGKLEPTAIKCIFVGYQPSVKGYKLWDPQIRRLCLVGILFLMSLLCFLTTYLLMLYLIENKCVGRALSSCTRYWL